MRLPLFEAGAPDARPRLYHETTPPRRWRMRTGYSKRGHSFQLRLIWRLLDCIMVVDPQEPLRQEDISVLSVFSIGTSWCRCSRRTIPCTGLRCANQLRARVTRKNRYSPFQTALYPAGTLGGGGPCRVVSNCFRCVPHYGAYCRWGKVRHGDAEIISSAVCVCLWVRLLNMLARSVSGSKLDRLQVNGAAVCE